MKHVKITHETHQSVVSVQLLVLEHVAEDGRGCSGSFLTPGAKSEGQQRVREDRRTNEVEIPEQQGRASSQTCPAV